ncbi:sugar ABC transporter ATP-binding protein [Schaalia sp. 19OD2882]|uniref:sugar ABC transporter ATP-binding protein n=1 Tax=Schaalia sp. 19OD2882 TaxID=2794089 RepID=UPI001C1E9512|nr:sugar ABC transporter ATP-binding protein [Schaalia sp. 19OD2882]QWW18802.1 sugar ABC transporter ATP-binding protein [Schaalia sp. 19OD2882]
MSEAPLLQMKGVSKRYPGVQALDRVNFELRPAEVHAIVGENGAGKSTLVKVMAGMLSDFEGVYEFEGRDARFHSIRDAQARGISVVHQELNMMGDLTVAQNIFIGRESAGFLVSDTDLNLKARELIDQFGIGVEPTDRLRDLSVGKAQLVEIARAMSFTSTKVLILDEPTAALSEAEAADLLRRVRGMKAAGVAVVYISHRMHEIMEISDRITVFRDGAHVGTLDTASTAIDEVIELMVGRKVINPKKETSKVPPDAEVVLEARNLTSTKVRGVSFDLRAGEILGFAGLVGAGRTETMQILFGADPSASGTLIVKGKEVHFTHPRDAVEKGIAYLSEDRKRYGLVVNLSVKDNVALPSYDLLAGFLAVRDGLSVKRAKEFVELLRIKTPSIHQSVRALSGGNQQKVVLAKWLLRDMDVLIFDEPTRGIDIGARAEIYELIRSLVEEGKSIILVSSDLDEILHLSDRVVVMSEGVSTGILDIAEATPVRIMAMATHHDDRKEQR